MRLDKARRLAPVVTGIAVKGGGAFASFVLTLVIARTLGATQTGYFALASATMTTATLVTLGGLDQLLVRTIAGDVREGRADLASAALRQVSFWVLVNGAIVALLLLVMSPLAYRIGLPEKFITPVAAAVFVLPLLRIASSTLRATGSRVFSLFFDGPLFTGLTAVVAVWAYWTDIQITTLTFVWILSGAVYGSLFAAYLALRSRIRRWPRASAKRYGSLAQASWPIFLSAVAQVMTDWLLLAQIGAMAMTAEVGAYRVAFQVVSVLSLMVSTVENLVAPGFAGDLRTNDLHRAKQRHRKASVGLLLAVGVPSVITFTLAGPLLSIFGPDFVHAVDALRILLAAQLINVLTGPVGVFLIMAKRERSILVLSYVALVASLAVGVTLIPIWGASGAATAYLTAIVIRNVGAFIIFLSMKEIPQSGT